MTSAGYTMQPSVTVPNGAQSISVGVDGVVSAVLAGQSDPIQVGTVQLVDFVNPASPNQRRTDAGEVYIIYGNNFGSNSFNVNP